MDVDKKLKQAVQFFWAKKAEQQKKQAESGKKDAGARGSVTGGAQMDGFLELVVEAILECKVPKECIFTKKGDVTLPGFFRPTKQWDIVVVEKGQLLAAIELKSITRSYGNNFNNRVEESLGNSTDLLRAFQNEQFGYYSEPFLGFLILVGDEEKSRRIVRVKEPHFPVLPEFRESSYQDRFLLLGKKLILERHYHAVCLTVSDEIRGRKGEYTEPDQILSIHSFICKLQKHIKVNRK